MKSMVGFKNNFGTYPLINDYVVRLLKDTARMMYYEEIQVPILECASTYSEDVLGKSPWPEWNNKGCFYFEINDYDESYEEDPITEKVLLIPEGTVSVTKWLGNQIRSGVQFPLKLFYNMNCYRNELVSTLSDTKGREFSQFGLEILGSDNPQSDIEILCMIIQSLLSLGLRKDEIRIRINDVSIFNKLVEECQLQESIVDLKSLLDTLAEIKAGKGIERKKETIEEIDRIFELHHIEGSAMDKWKSIINQNDYRLDDIVSKLGATYCDKINSLNEICLAFQETQVNVVADLCVIRSHEYYTGISYEVDVQTDKTQYIEIAGGGRYDRLVSNFVPANCEIQTVPCTGFAFGVERVIDMIQKEDRIPEYTHVNSFFCFHRENKKYVVPADRSPQSYIREFQKKMDIDETVCIKI